MTREWMAASLSIEVHPAAAASHYTCNTHNTCHVPPTKIHKCQLEKRQQIKILPETVLLPYASPCLWNQLPSSLRQPHSSLAVSYVPVHAPTTSSHSANSALSPSISPSLFHSRLKTYLCHKSFPP